MLVSDPLTARAEALVSEVGGEVVSGNGELADRADVIVLCHKPPQLEQVAQQVGGRAKRVVSILGAVCAGLTVTLFRRRHYRKRIKMMEGRLKQW